MIDYLLIPITLLLISVIIYVPIWQVKQNKRSKVQPPSKKKFN